MQTFILDKDFTKSASMLDVKRLGKQRVETMQLLTTLTGLKYDNDSEKVIKATKKGWTNHPASKMWRGYERALLEYQKDTCNYWISLGFKDTCLWKSEMIFEASDCSKKLVLPEWLNEDFINAHRSALLFKDDEFYSKYNWNVPKEYNYIWPVE